MKLAKSFDRSLPAVLQNLQVRREAGCGKSNDQCRESVVKDRFDRRRFTKNGNLKCCHEKISGKAAC